MQIRNRQPALAIHLDAVIHAAAPRPAVLNHAEGPALKLHHRHCFIIRLGLRRMHIRTQVRIHTHHLRPAEKPVSKRNPVAPKIQQRTATRLLHIPEPLRMRTKMFFTLLDQVNFAERPGIRHFFRLHILRRKKQLLRIQQQHAMFAARRNHPVRLFQRHAQRLFADHVLACLCQRQRHLAMQCIRRSNRHRIDFRISRQLAIIRIHATNLVLVRQSLRIPRGR